MGLALHNASLVEIYGPRIAGRRIACWGGSGGSFVMNDLDSRFGLTFSVPASGQQSIKFVYSTGATTRRGNDFNAFNVTWQLVWF